MCYSMIGFYIIDLIWINTKFAILKIGGIEHFRHDSLINIIARLNSTAGGNGGLNTRWLAKRVTSRPIVSNWLKQVNFNGFRRPATLDIGMIDYIRFEWNLESALLVVRWESISINEDMVIATLLTIYNVAFISFVFTFRWLLL